MNRKERRRQAKETQKQDKGGKAIDLAHKGAELANSGQLDDAIDAFRHAVATDPNFAEAHYNLGVLLRLQGRIDEAVESYQNAVLLQPDFAEAHYNIGNARLAQNRLEDAIASYRKAVTIRPGFAEAHNNLANAYKELEKLEEALTCGRKALEIKPDFAEAQSNLGAILRDMGKPEEALPHCQKAIELAPDYPQAQNNLALALQDGGALEQAVTHFQKALSLLPAYPEAHSNLGIAQQVLGRLEEAQASYQNALDIDANCVEAYNNLGMLQLLRGDFENGWKNFAWQWQMKGATTIARDYPEPYWDGGDLKGKTLFVYPVQGFGDFIQFSRYIPLLKTKGGRIIVEVPTRLHVLFSNLEGADGIISAAEQPGAFDVQARLLDLPGLFKTSPATIPERKDLYLPPDLNEKWAGRLGDYKGKRVGLVWAGNPDHKNDHNRSIDPVLIKPLLGTEGAQFFSLQVGRDGEAREVFDSRVIDLAPELASFTETAAVMKNLDLIISIDSAPAHLAGALDRPVWTLLPFMPDWRWLLDRNDSPWYPSMRLFRQDAIGDWAGVIEKVKRALEGID